MTLSITIDDIKINEWSVNLVMQRVSIIYTLCSGDDEWATHTALFWVTLPDEPIEGRDFQLPAAYIQPLLDLTTDAKTALITYWGI